MYLPQPVASCLRSLTPHRCRPCLLWSFTRRHPARLTSSMPVGSWKFEYPLSLPLCRVVPVQAPLRAAPHGCMFCLTQAPQSTLAAVGRGASSEKDMCEVRTTDELYNPKVKRAGSVHDLGEVRAR